MLRKLLMLGAVLGFCTILSARDDGGRTQLIDNFNDGDDHGWSHADFTPNGSAVFDASSGVYVIESTEPIPADDISAGAMAATWEPSRNTGKYTNGVARVRFRANTADTTGGIVLRANDETHVNYGFYGSASFGTFYIERFDGSQANPQTIIAMADPEETPFNADEDWIIEAGLIGQWLWLKAWKVGEREPRRPQLLLRDKAIGPDDGTLVCLIVFFDPAAVEGPDVELSATFDNLTFARGLSD